MALQEALRLAQVSTEVPSLIVSLLVVLSIVLGGYIIVERNQLVEALRESELRFELAFAGSEAAVWDLKYDPEDSQGAVPREIYLSPAMKRSIGYDDHEFPNSVEAWQSRIIEEDLPGLLKSARDHLEGKTEIREVEYRVRHKDGSLRWIHGCGRIQHDRDGVPWRWSGVDWDVTEREAAEEEVHRNAAHTEKLVKTAALFNTQLDLEDVLWVVCEQAALSLQAPASSVTLYDPETEVFNLAAVYGMPQEAMQRFKPIPFRLYDKAVQQRGPTIVIPDLREIHDVPNGDLAALYDIRTTVIVSLVRQGELVGTLNVHTFGDTRSFGEDELGLLRGLADQGALAITNGRLLNEVSEQHRHLRALTAQMVEVEETERKRLARELHDEVGQNLTFLGINLRIMEGLLPEDLTTSIGDRINDSQRLLEQTVDRMRSVMADLQPPVLDDYGLVSALRWYCEQFTLRTGMDVEVIGDESVPRLPSSVETALFRIAREALTNVAKHARAPLATIAVEVKNHMLRLTVADNGCGFEPHALPAVEGTRWGLMTMKERAQAIGGRYRLVSHLGKGTQVIVEVPV